MSEKAKAATTDTDRLNFLEQECSGCALVEDDCGHWALLADGAQNLPESDTSGPFDYGGFFYSVEESGWSDSIREAIDRAISEIAGPAGFVGGAEEHQSLSLRTTPEVVKGITYLFCTGYFGSTLEEAAEQLVRERLRQLLPLGTPNEQRVRNARAARMIRQWEQARDDTDDERWDEMESGRQDEQGPLSSEASNGASSEASSEASGVSPSLHYESLRVNDHIWIPCDVKPGPFGDERLARVQHSNGTWVGFAHVDNLSSTVESGRASIMARVTGVQTGYCEARVCAHSITAGPIRVLLNEVVRVKLEEKRPGARLRAR